MSAGPVKPTICRGGQMLYALTDEQADLLNWRLRELAWGDRDLADCKCDHCESCEHCYPPEFRPGGLWASACQAREKQVKRP